MLRSWLWAGSRDNAAHHAAAIRDHLGRDHRQLAVRSHRPDLVHVEPEWGGDRSVDTVDSRARQPAVHLKMRFEIVFA